MEEITTPLAPVQSGIRQYLLEATTGLPKRQDPPVPDRAELEHEVVAVHQRLAAAGLPHAIGGAVALGAYAEPRPTADIDVNVFVAAEREPEVRAALSGLDSKGEHPVHL